jgi:hypothetical protein
MALSLPCEGRSQTEYRFREDEADSIIQTSAYHPERILRSAVWFSPSEHVTIRPSIATPFPSRPNAGLGSLNRLPLELLQMISLHLDIHSLFNFRQACSSTRQVVDSLHEYQLLVAHGLNLLCALLRTGLATGLATCISLPDFYDALCTEACAFCGEFAGFIYFLTWDRCCYQCLERPPATIEPQTVAKLRKGLRLTKGESTRLKSLKTLPGRYRPIIYTTYYKARVAIASIHQAISLASRLGKLQPGRAREAAAAALSTNCLGGRERALPFMGSCALPHYDRRTGKVEHGIACLGCKLNGSGPHYWLHPAKQGDREDILYTRDGFLEHFRWCESAQILVKQGGAGHATEDLEVLSD